MDNNIKIQEEKHLKNTILKIKDALDFLESNLEKLGISTLERLKELRENPETGMDFLLLLEQLHEKHAAFNLKDKFLRQEELNYLKKEPYFSRIDLFDPKIDKTDSIYIGKFGYTEEMPVVTDWRAAVASVYYKYRYPQKNVKYDTPDGKVIKDLKLKRTFEIDKGQLIKYYNNDIQFDESEIIAGKIEQRTGGVLEDIVETIQSDQMEIIETDPRQICIVQGCVGSGKSTVAIHKLSHIFFNYSNFIKPERSILIAKNQILVGYLSTLFPKLGIFDINYKTLKDLIVNIIFRENIDINYDLDIGEDTSRFSLKEIEKINGKIDKVHREYRIEIENIFKDPEFDSYGGYKYNLQSTPLDNINEIKTDLEEEISLQKEIYKENPSSIKGILSKQNVRSIRKIINKLTKLASRLKNKSFNELLKNSSIDKGNQLNYSETLLLVYIYTKLIGIKSFPPYEYCVVDEGQDFSLLEYLLLDKVVLRGRIGIFGDLNQSLEDDGISHWDDLKNIFGVNKKLNIFKLTRNYRSTKQIVNFAVKILSPFSNEFMPESIERHGTEPEYKIFDTNEQMMKNFVLDIKDEIVNIKKSIGIICFDKKLIDEVHEILHELKIYESKIIRLEKTKKVQYVPQRVYYMTTEDCKGLEFAKVYVLGLNTEKICDYSTAKKAFVTVTRAMNELTVMGIK